MAVSRERIYFILVQKAYLSRGIDLDASVASTVAELTKAYKRKKRTHWPGTQSDRFCLSLSCLF